jgi:hypothetical protein
MMFRRKTYRILTALMLVGLVAGAARADLEPLETFDGLCIGPICDQGGWLASAVTSVVAADPVDETNLVLEVGAESDYLFRSLSVPSDGARMMFLRFRFADQLVASFGTSDAVHPTQYGDFEVELALNNTRDELRVNDGGTYDDVAAVTEDTWYNCWVYIDNAHNLFSVWLHDRTGEDAVAEDRLTVDGQDQFVFRGMGADDMATFFIKTSGGEGNIGPLYIDDIHLETTGAVTLANPTNPAPDEGGDDPDPDDGLNGERWQWQNRIGKPLVHPNPSSGKTGVAFTMSMPGRVTARIYDIRGRMVSELASGDFDEGSHQLFFRGVDDHGRVLPAGTYMLRVESGGQVQTTRMSLVR